MIGLLIFVLRLLFLPFKPKLRLEAENAALRLQRERRIDVIEFIAISRAISALTP